MAAALLQSLPWLAEGDEGLNALLLTLTGGLTLAPTCLVFWHHLPAPSGGRWGRRWWRSRLTGAGGI